MDKQAVIKALENPIKNIKDIQILALTLCNHPVNINCQSCVNDAVRHLSIWLKDQGVQNDYSRRAASGEYELKKINLFVQVYESYNESRQKELNDCLAINKSLNINGVPCLNVIEIKERLKFSELFDLTKNYKDDINIISNSDIFFNETILMSRFIQSNQCYALSRWDYKQNKQCILFNRKDSQDVWIFNGAVNCTGGDYTAGTPGCDNKLAFELKQSGYIMSNPAKSIHTIHLHNTNFRTYNANSFRLQEPFHFLLPHF